LGPNDPANYGGDKENKRNIPKGASTNGSGDKNPTERKANSTNMVSSEIALLLD